MRRHWQYLKYVLRHKWFVLLAGIDLGVPIWILILHDWDKFLPDEWLPYARCFYAPDGTKQYKPDDTFTKAWMLHQHRNKHHWQWYLNAGNTPLSQTNIIVWDKGNASIIIDDVVHDWHGEISIREAMPDVYAREMLADWRGAGRALGNPDTKAWYLANKDNMKLHPNTRAWISYELGLTEVGIDYATN